VKKEISHILVPTDFSAFSNRAFRFASRLADLLNAKITLFHVVEPPYNFATAIKGMIEMMEKNALSRMQQLIDSSDYEIKIETQIRHGRTSLEILDCVDREQVDLVVMGSRGQSKLSRAVLGSVSEKIAHQLQVPLFLIPDASDDPVISSLIFTTDFRKDDPGNLLFASSVAGYLDADVLPVHMTKDYDFDDRIRHHGFTDVIQEETGDDTLRVEIVNSKNLLHGIAEFADKHKHSALVFNRYKKSVLQKLFKKDHTDEMVVYSDIPLLIIPSGLFSDSP